jgi:hypothetical protein
VNLFIEIEAARSALQSTAAQARLQKDAARRSPFYFAGQSPGAV